MRDDPACTEIIKPYLRGQDIDRWWAPESGLFMILLKSSADHPWPWANSSDKVEAERRFRTTYPSLHAHMKNFEEFIDPKTGKTRGLGHREDQGRFWWELRICAYYGLFYKQRVAYQAIQFYPRYAVETQERLGNNKTYFLPTTDPFVAASLNSPAGWYFSWSHFLHLKDEALSNDQVKIRGFPLPAATDCQRTKAKGTIDIILGRTREIDVAAVAVSDWLRHEFDINKLGRSLQHPHTLDVDSFVTSVRAAVPKTRKWSAAEIGRLKQEHSATVAPARTAAAEVIKLERKLSDLVNAAYGLTQEEVALMWRTAPPRMPLDPKEELRRLGLTN